MYCYLPTQELLEGSTISKTGTTYFNVIQQTKICNLVKYSSFVKEVRALLIVWFDATAIVRSCL